MTKKSLTEDSGSGKTTTKDTKVTKGLAGAKNLLGFSDAEIGVPTDRGCSTEEHEKIHEKQKSKPIRFF